MIQNLIQLKETFNKKIMKLYKFQYIIKNFKNQTIEKGK